MYPFYSAGWTTQQHGIVGSGKEEGGREEEVSQLHLATGRQELIKARASIHDDKNHKECFPQMTGSLCVWFEAVELRQNFIQPKVVISADMPTVIPFHFVGSIAPYQKEIDEINSPSVCMYLWLKICAKHL